SVVGAQCRAVARRSVLAIPGARLVPRAGMGLLGPPDLLPGRPPHIGAAGINEWGGVSPLTADFVNPEAPWPHLDQLERETRAAGKHLQERLTIYPRFALDAARWVDAGLRAAVLRSIDAEGLARAEDWVAGGALPPPQAD